MVIYFCITIIANIAAAIVFHKSISITGLSIIPLLLIAVMIFQALVFKKERVENGFQSAYGSNLKTNEENSMFRCASTFLFATIPWMIPFILFFPPFAKVLSVLVYIVGLVGGLLLYRIKNKGSIMNRMDAEETERREQEKREQLGQWK